MTVLFKFLLITSVVGFITNVHATMETPIGYWRTEDGKAKVQVYECGTKTVCGKIIELKEPIDPQTGKSKADLQGKPLIGMEIMKSFKYKEENEWTDGSIYDPKEGKT